MTNGHWQVIRLAAEMFEEVTIGFGANSEKKRLTDRDKMAEATRVLLARAHLDHVRVVTYDTLTYQAAQAAGAQVLVRGLRNGVDYDFEENLAEVNARVGGLETIYIRAGQMGFVSSSMVREMLIHGEKVAEFVPREIAGLLEGAQGQIAAGARGKA